MARRAGVVSVDVDPNLSQVGSKIDAFARALKPLGLRVEAVDKFSSVIGSGARSSQASLNSISTSKAQGELTSLGRVGSRELEQIGSKARLSGAALVGIGGGTALAGARLVGSLKPAVDAASALNETVSFSKQVFGESSKAIEAFGAGAATKLGQSKREAIDAANTFGIFGKQAGLTGKELVGFSESLTGLASDLASARDTTVGEAITAIGAAIRGESEPISRYGADVREAAVQQEALALKISDGKAPLTQQQRTLAVQSLLFKQLSDSVGDFARTSGSAANSTKTLNASLENTKAEEGKGLLGVLSAANKFGGELLNTLDKIPGATTALGVGLAGVGTAAVAGGALTSIVGAVRTVGELRGKLRPVGGDLDTVSGSAAKVGSTVSTIGPIGQRSFGALGFAAKAAGAALATAGIAEAMFEIVNAAQDVDRDLTDSLNRTVAAAGKGGGDIVKAFTSSANVERNTLKFSHLFDRFGTDFRIGGQGGVKDIEDFQAAFDKLLARSPQAAQSLIDALREMDKGLNKNGEDYKETEKLLNLWQGSVTAAAGAQAVQAGETDRQAGALGNLPPLLESGAAGMDRFGFAIDATKTKWSQYADSLEQAINPLKAAMDAQSALADSQRDLADKQQKLQDILSGNTDGVKSAREALDEAKADLNKSIASTGPGSDAAESALQSLHDALKALHDAKVEAGKAPRDGDFFDDRRQQVADAEARVRKAQKELDRANSRSSDEVVSARDRVTKAQKRLNDELAKTGPRSKEAIDAQRDVDEAERNQVPLAAAVQAAYAAVRDELEKHPGAIEESIKKVDEWVKHGVISVAVAEEWKKKLLEIVAASKEAAGISPMPAPPADSGAGRSNEQPPSAFKPNPNAKPTPTRTLPSPVSQFDAASRGLPPFPPDIPGRKVEAKGSDGFTYTFDPDRHRWVPHFADGGFLEDDRTFRRPIGSQLTRTIGSQFPTQPGILANRPGGLTKVVGFEGRTGQWEGFVPGDPAKRPQAVKVTREIAQRFGYDLIEKKKLTRVGGASMRAFADGGFLGAPAAKPPPIVAPVEGQTVASEASIRELIAEVRSLRGEQMSTLRDMIRAATGAGSTEPLAPLLRAIEGNTRNRGPGGFAGMADLRQREAGLAR